MLSSAQKMGKRSACAELQLRLRTHHMAGLNDLHDALLQTPPPPPELVDWAQNTAIAALAGSAVSGGRAYLRERQQAGTRGAHNTLPLHTPGVPQPAGDQAPLCKVSGSIRQYQCHTVAGPQSSAALTGIS